MLVDTRASGDTHSSIPVPRVQSLKQAGIEYVWAGNGLGGRRESRLSAANSALPSPALRGYAVHVESAAIRGALERTLRLAARKSTVLICSERGPSQCHRSLMADVLTLNDIQVHHLIAPGLDVEHRLHSRARLVDGTIKYDDQLCLDL